jgi:hypothetical protein
MIASRYTYEYLLYSENLDRKNDGRLTDYWLKRYEHLENGGWWCNGIDPNTNQDALWGCFKPDTPRHENKKDKTKPIKYEHPPKQNTEVFALKVSDRIWEKVAEKSKTEKKGDDFWQWVKNTFTPSYKSEIEAYLADSTCHADVENRIKLLQRRGMI